MSVAVKFGVDSFYAQSGGLKVYSAYSWAPFDQAVSALDERGFAPISLEQQAQLRMAKGRMSHPSLGGNYVSEGFIHIPSDGIYMVRNSPVLTSPRLAVSANRDRYEYQPARIQIAKALVEAVRIPYDLPPIPTDRFGEDELTSFAFGASAAEYGQFLKAALIDEMPVWTLHQWMVDSQARPFARQAFIRCLDNWSGLISNNMDLQQAAVVRGICKTEESAFEVVEETFSLDQIAQALEQASFAGARALLFKNFPPDRHVFTTIDIVQALGAARLSGVEYDLFECLFQGHSLALHYPLGD